MAVSSEQRRYEILHGRQQNTFGVSFDGEGIVSPAQWRRHPRWHHVQEGQHLKQARIPEVWTAPNPLLLREMPGYA